MPATKRGGGRGRKHGRGGFSPEVVGRSTSTGSKRRAPALSDTDSDLVPDVSPDSARQTQHKRPRTSEVNAEPEGADIQHDGPPSGTAETPSAAVTVRRTTRHIDPHPARTQGLHKRSKNEISRGADKKRADKQVEADAREENSRLLAEKESSGAAAIATMKDGRVREDILLDEAGEPLGERSEEDVDMGEQDEGEDGIWVGDGGSRTVHDDTEAQSESGSGPEYAPVSASTRKDKKHERVASVRAATSRRQSEHTFEESAAPSRDSHSSKTKASKASSSAKKNQVSVTSKTSGLNENWRAIIDGAGLTQDPTADLTTTAPKKCRTKGSLKGGPKEENAVQEKGLEDGDVVSRKEDAVVLRKSQAQFVDIIDVEAEATPAKAKRTRRAPADVPQEKSRGAAAVVPAAIFAVWSTKIHPTLIEHYGSLDNPWDISLDDVQETITAILSKVCPRFRFVDLTDTQCNKFIEHCATKVRDWRKGLLLKAKRLVDADLKLVEGGKAGRAKHVENALKPHGAAFNNVADEKAGRMKSVYILKTFAKHLKILENSHIHRPRPYGALALCYAAVQASFEQWESGSDKGTPAWDGDAARDLVLGAFRTNIAWLSRHPDQFDAIIKAAKDTQKSEKYRQPREPKQRVVRLYTPSESEGEGGDALGDSGRQSSTDVDEDGDEYN
ncbi:uncharacterized protein B0H18DRAFT_1123913 [Fomitopsis serialis]|uniref:uncharacterized protein n=1 Tax=Fomitopsis serialis TaxID=139415 RepID=UPI0020071F83|nr:uncharacterized protein B0H18DRAFT_1123913 [Neoantrodia serialis]KAH9916927.1 hypothetical protein B0H18DRAFT_1123913 [Neoantrodia serialis]